jgi:hypothetical protein
MRMLKALRGVCVAACIATMVTLAFGAEVGLAADYEDGKGNVCEGAFDCSEWGKHVTGTDNVALGFDMMPALTSGEHNAALDFGALFANTTGANNVASGFEALASNTGGLDNIASGTDALASNKTGSENIASGRGALESNTTGLDNLASGTFALASNTTGCCNIAIGFHALKSDIEGGGNIASGVEALAGNTTGSSNVALGSRAGTNLTTGYNNIDVSNEGVAAEEATTRIGTEGKQTKTFVAGVHNSNLSGCSVQVTSGGQLGCNNNTAGSAVATYKSTKKVLTGKCLNFTGDATPGTGACPAATGGYSASKLLSSPMPANGATVSNLAANTSATVSGGDTAVVEVIDNTTTTVLLTCTVNSTTKNYCTNDASTGTAAVREKLEVRITAVGTSGNEKFWEVTFRY